MLQCIATVALVAVLETGKTVVIRNAVGLAGLNGHASEVFVGGGVECARVSFVGAAEVGPGVDGLARDGHPRCG